MGAPNYVCSFCARPSEECKTLVVAPSNDAGVCDRCLELARDIVGHRRILEGGAVVKLASAATPAGDAADDTARRASGGDGGVATQPLTGGPARRLKGLPDEGEAILSLETDPATPGGLRVRAS